jgi:hypothetical protein
LVNSQPIILQPSIPKRGSRACTACRKGKNRCEGDVRPHFFFPVVPNATKYLQSAALSTLYDREITLQAYLLNGKSTHNRLQAPCKRCQLSGAQCVFEKPEKKNIQVATGSIEYVLLPSPEIAGYEL